MGSLHPVLSFCSPSVMCFVFREGSSVLSGDLEDDGSALPDPSPSESSLGRRRGANLRICHLVAPEGLALECAVLALSRSTGRGWQKGTRRGKGEEKRREVGKRESTVGSALELTSACHGVLVLARVAWPKDLPRSHLPTQPIVSTHGLG